MCLVEVEGKRGFATSCIQKVEEGMVVHTKTPEVLEARKTIFNFAAACKIVVPSRTSMFLPSIVRFIISIILPIGILS